MKKQYILLLLALSTALSFTDCGNTSQDASAGTVSTATVDNTEILESIEDTEITTEVVVESEVETDVVDTETNSETSDYVSSIVNYFDTNEFKGATDSLKCVKNDPRYQVVDGYYNGVPLKGKDNATSWSQMIIWVSSEGTELKINDKYAYLATQEDIQGITAALWLEDPDADERPDSDWSKAIIEFVYGIEGLDGGTDRYNPEVVDVDNLPKVTTVSEKKSSFEVTDEFQAYIDEWNLYHSFQATGLWNYNPLYMLQVDSNFAGAAAMGSGYLWDIQRTGDYWTLTIRRNLSELNWDGILTCLKMVSPDAQEVFDNAIYEQFYNGCDWILDYDGWYDIPNSKSKIMVPSTAPQGEVWFYLK